MEAVKIELEGITASFRYPHFLVGRQPSYPLPPPATIYGIICCAVGEWIDASGLKFAYSFTKSGGGNDYEYIYKMIGTEKGGMEKEMGMEPLLREMFLHPSLTLYLTSSESVGWIESAFRMPRYPMSIGRSQDLATVKSVDIIRLQEADSGYFEGTILPLEYGLSAASGTLLRMPKFIDPRRRTDVHWGEYLAVEPKVRLGARGGDVLVDTFTQEFKDLKRIVHFMEFT